MADFLLDEDVVDEPQGSGASDLFPKGAWEGVLEEVRVRTIVSGDQADFLLNVSKEVVADEVKVVSFRFGDFVARLDGQPNVGARKFFTEDVVIGYTSGMNVVDWLRPAEDDAPRMAFTRRYLTNLARALGMVDRDGKRVGPSAQFTDGLEHEGAGLLGSRVVLQVGHRNYKKRDGTQATKHYVTSFEAAI